MTIQAINAVVPGAIVETAALIMPAAILGVVLSRAWPRLRGTTLVAAWCWAVVALGAILAVELAAIGAPADKSPEWLPAARYIAAVATFCPTVAVLGAKRPQERAWQLIVLSLWGVLSLPAIQDVVYHYGQPLDLDPAWQWFLALLLAVGMANYLPTRYAASSVLVFAAQAVLLGDFLPVPVPVSNPLRVIIALGLAALAACAAVARWPGRRHGTDALHNLWLDFRDWYGILWALRVRERAGDSTSPATGEGGQAATIGDTFVAHLQRFVSREWVAQRVEKLPNGQLIWRGSQWEPEGSRPA
jgi:hypothetical protein